jgi:hypothetical protein
MQCELRLAVPDKHHILNIKELLQIFAQATGRIVVGKAAVVAEQVIKAAVVLAAILVVAVMAVIQPLQAVLAAVGAVGALTPPDTVAVA